jgi:hypothetical protein
MLYQARRDLMKKKLLNSPLLQETPDLHGFVMMGMAKIFFCHLAMLHVNNHRYQLIFPAEIGANDMEVYLKTRKENPNKALIIGNHNPMILKDLIAAGSFLADAYIGMPDSTSKPFLTPTVNVKTPLLFQHLDPDAEDYPEYITYYIYGTDSELHISHLISKAPNFQQELDIKASSSVSDRIKNKSGIIKISIPSMDEKKIQPIRDDPLTEQQYNIRMENGSINMIEIQSKYWFDITMLNMK